jgi:murein DD-endopeptidase MepM/ murein hydrolase activator NlpD
MRNKIHKGVDIGAPVGTPIVAMKDGIVAYADNTIRGYGNLLSLVHGDASVSNYGHCNAIYVFPGQKVRRGQVVAEVGNTGYSGGPHLHFEYRVGGRAIDPKPFLIDSRPRGNRRPI